MSISILLVDDAEDCMATLNLALETSPGIIVRTARSAEDALKVLAENTVGAMVTDVHLPNMSGLELISQVRKKPHLSTLPIIVVSADPDPATPRYAEKLGANAFFSKPFSPGAVRKKLEELLHG